VRYVLRRCPLARFPRVQVSTGTTDKALAKEILVTLRRMRDVGRRDVVGLVASGHLRLADLHEAYIAGSESLEQLIARTASPR
jgi:hypothetical protein